MVIGIGTDIIRVSRFEGKKEYFYDSIFTDSEKSYLDEKLYAPQTIAGLYAAKEALLKAIGTGISGDVGLLDIEILHNKKRAPYYNINKTVISVINKIHKISATKNNINIKLSISHDGEYASAFAIIEQF